MTPLVDVVFNLLIFFMLSSSFVVHPGIKIKLPPASSQETQGETKLNVTITREGKLFLNEKSVSLKQLPQAIKMLLEGEGENVMFIKADADVKHGLVVEVMDTAKNSGVDRMAIATEPR